MRDFPICGLENGVVLLLKRDRAARSPDLNPGIKVIKMALINAIGCLFMRIFKVESFNYNIKMDDLREKVTNTIISETSERYVLFIDIIMNFFYIKILTE